jgi:hypothetical protein
MQPTMLNLLGEHGIATVPVAVFVEAPAETSTAAPITQDSVQVPAVNRRELHGMAVQLLADLESGTEVPWLVPRADGWLLIAPDSRLARMLGARLDRASDLVAELAVHMEPLGWIAEFDEAGLRFCRRCDWDAAQGRWWPQA